MAQKTAKVDSVDAVAAFEEAFREFGFVARDALETLLKEAHRGLMWLEQDRTRFWPAEARRRSDQLNEARQQFHACKRNTVSDFEPSCFDELKALRRAKVRLEQAEETIKLVRHWCVVMRHEITEFEGQVRRVGFWLDSDFPRALASLDHMYHALQKYISARPASFPRLDQAKPALGKRASVESDESETT